MDTGLATTALNSEIAHRTNANHPPFEARSRTTSQYFINCAASLATFSEYTETKMVNADTHCEILVIRLEVWQGSRNN